MNLEKLRCFIPIGGQAKRLMPLTHDISKPCVRFLNRPLIEFSMATSAEQGVRSFSFGEYGYTSASHPYPRADAGTWSGDEENQTSFFASCRVSCGAA